MNLIVTSRPDSLHVAASLAMFCWMSSLGNHTVSHEILFMLNNRNAGDMAILGTMNSTYKTVRVFYMILSIVLSSIGAWSLYKLRIYMRHFFHDQNSGNSM